MTRTLFASLLLIAGLAAATAASAREFRFFDAGDRVIYQRSDRIFEPLVEPHIYLPRARRAFENGQRWAAAENLSKAAVGFDYFKDRAAGDDRRQLALASRALDKLARQVRRGEIDEVTTLDRAIADAERVLAGEPAPAPAAPSVPEPPAALRS